MFNIDPVRSEELLRVIMTVHIMFHLLGQEEIVRGTCIKVLFDRY